MYIYISKKVLQDSTGPIPQGTWISHKADFPCLGQDILGSGLPTQALIVRSVDAHEKIGLICFPVKKLLHFFTGMDRQTDAERDIHKWTLYKVHLWMSLCASLVRLGGAGGEFRISVGKVIHNCKPFQSRCHFITEGMEGLTFWLWCFQQWPSMLQVYGSWLWRSGRGSDRVPKILRLLRNSNTEWW